MTPTTAFEWDALADADLPSVVGRIKRRKNESDTAWRDRGRDHLIAQAQKAAARAAKEAAKAQKKKSRLAKRSPETIHVVCSVFGVSTDIPDDPEIEAGHNNPEGYVPPIRLSQAEWLATLVDVDVPVLRVPGAAPATHPQMADVLNDVDGLMLTRLRMTGWVTDTLDTRQNEAICDLDCISCPRHQLLVCRLINGSLLPQTV